MSNATGRAVLGQAGVVDKRRSAFEATKLSTSTEKADDDLESDFMHRCGDLPSIFSPIEMTAGPNSTYIHTC
jgi:hypothetical protein